MKLILVFPNRGELPPDQPGYTRDPRNPRIFKMTWVPCVHRGLKKLPCGGCGTGEWCNLFEFYVKQHACNACSADKISLPMVQP